MKIVLLGPPGAGKGSQAALITKKIGIPAISTGVIFREAMAQGTDLGKTAQMYISKGELVPDDIVIGIVKQRLEQPDCENGYILDGFPRTLAQAEALDRMLPDAVDIALSLEVPDEVIIYRLTGRRECLKCGMIYHLQNNPPSKGDVCDRCGGALIQRADDQIDTIKNRISVYKAQTEPIKDYYHAQGKLTCIDGSGEVAKVGRDLFKVLGL